MPTGGRDWPGQLRQGSCVVELHPTHAAQISGTEALATAAVLGLGPCQLPDDVVLASGRAASWSSCCRAPRRRCR